jgi:hypothetical protein
MSYIFISFIITLVLYVNPLIKFLMAYVFIDKIVYYNNKKLIKKFINKQNEAKINFQNNSDKMYVWKYV